jgi:hypothetical protein
MREEEIIKGIEYSQIQLHRDKFSLEEIYKIQEHGKTEKSLQKKYRNFLNHICDLREYENSYSAVSI